MSNQKKKKKRVTSVYYYNETLWKRRLCDLKINLILDGLLTMSWQNHS